MSASARFLLDQHFPTAPFPVERLDKRVEYVPLRVHAPELAHVSTPDWMVYIAAALGDFDGLVTSDHSQTTEDTELVALSLTKINLVTWRGREEDQATLWGQLLAYMPQILKHMEAGKPHVFYLPNPRFQPKQNMHRPVDIARARQQNDGLSYPERESREVKVMRRGLVERGRDDWVAWLDERLARRGRHGSG